jgi:hypothetical protein
MKSPVVSLLCSVLVLCGSGSLAAEVTVRPVGLRIVQASARPDTSQMRPFNHDPGVIVVLEFATRGARFIGLVDDASRIESMVDDTGKDLLAESPSGEPASRDFWDFTTISEDGKILLVHNTLRNPPAFPAKEATEIRYTGVCTMRTAQGKRTLEGTFPLESDAEASAGPLEITLSKIEPDGGYGRYPYKLTFRFKGPREAIESFELVDGQGEALDQRVASIITSRFGGEAIHRRSIRLARAPDGPITLRVGLWQDLRTVEVPFDLTFGLGL